MVRYGVSMLTPLSVSFLSKRLGSGHSFVYP
jgi:hypothetical protein